MTMHATGLVGLELEDRSVGVVGLGIEGVDLARFLCRRNADVTISDSKTAEQLATRLDDIRDLSVHLSLGSDIGDDLAQAEMVFVSQGVPLDLPGLRDLRDRGTPILSMTSLFLELCPGPIVGITGSSGKTTTTALVGAMFEADERPSFVGGNIGIGLLDRLSDIRPYTWSILEMSHTQLQLVDRSPHIAAILNITPNHLDRFAWDEYRELKANIIRYQTPRDIAILGYDDPECRALEQLTPANVRCFSMSTDIPGDGVFVRDGRAVMRLGRATEMLFPLAEVRLRGKHNQLNAVAAAAIAIACGISTEAIACAVETFRGVPHRLELVAEIDGVSYYNDSIATTPERTVAGIRSFEEPVVLLLGGREKNLPLEELIQESNARCRSVIVFGEAAAHIEAAFRAEGATVPVIRVDSLGEAADAARGAARPGDVVLLSPACTSYDAYENFERRGEHFSSLVRESIKEVEPSLR
jgi:UDP-N-acetylmuramoylalanine--D-glutamate ligase